MTKFIQTPIIIPKYPQINFDTAWKSCFSDFLDPELRTSNFKICHRVTPVNVVLFQYSIGDTMDCTFCGKKYCETFEHLFIACLKVRALWFYVKKLLRSLCNHRLKVDSENVLFCQLKKGTRSVKDMNLILYIISLAKYCIWFVRCQRKYEHIPIDGASCLRLFIKKLKFRISADLVRWDEVKFAEYWGRGDLICSVSNEGQLEFKF